MVEIILGVLIGAVGGIKLLGAIARKSVKENGGRSLGAQWVFFILLYGAMFGMVGGIVGFGINLLLPAPSRPVEERTVVQTLLPFPKDNETDFTVYAIKLSSGSINVRYNDGAAIKVGLCCDGVVPKIVEVDESPSIKAYHRPNYIGWFSFRWGYTSYEIRVPPNTVTSEKKTPFEILR